MLLDFFVDSCLQYLSKLCVGVVEITLVITNFTPYHSQGVLRPLFPGSADPSKQYLNRCGGIFFETDHSHRAVIVLSQNFRCKCDATFAAMCKFALLKTSSFVFARLM